MLGTHSEMLPSLNLIQHLCIRHAQYNNRPSIMAPFLFWVGENRLNFSLKIWLFWLKKKKKVSRLLWQYCHFPSRAQCQSVTSDARMKIPWPCGSHLCHLCAFPNTQQRVWQAFRLCMNECVYIIECVGTHCFTDENTSLQRTKWFAEGNTASSCSTRTGPAPLTYNSLFFPKWTSLD